MARIRFLIAAAILAAVTNSVTAERVIEGTVTYVRDVDTIEIGGLPVRLNRIDGAELDQRQGRNAKASMQKLTLHKPVRCVLDGNRIHDRWVGVCYLRSGEDTGALAIAADMARDCPCYSGGRYQRFETAESRALPQHGYCRRR